MQVENYEPIDTIECQSDTVCTSTISSITTDYASPEVRLQRDISPDSLTSDPRWITNVDYEGFGKEFINTDVFRTEFDNYVPLEKLSEFIGDDLCCVRADLESEIETFKEKHVKMHLDMLNNIKRIEIQTMKLYQRSLIGFGAFAIISFGSLVTLIIMSLR